MLRLLFNKYTISLIIALIGNQHLNKVYEGSTLTAAEHKKMEQAKKSGTPLGKDDQKAINDKEKLQKKFGYKVIIARYEETKAYYLKKAAEKLKPVRKKLDQIRPKEEQPE